ncbi:MAG TPA: phospholipase D family protein [Candidatus Paceibacterota bacterium]|nr:phospholipase D family protein [Candidatus Paceibacterota bacterium]
MTTRSIHQSVTEESLFNTIAEWCKSGAGQKGHTLHILSAFASGSGVSAITPLLDVFLADGNEIHIIVGIDRNGTDKDALKHLHSLAQAYETQCTVQVFQAPSRQAIFHPKLYVFRKPSTLSFVIGSSNLTSGGLSANFESLMLFSGLPNSSPEAANAVSIWNIFAHPKPPLKRHYLRTLTRAYLKTLSKRLPDRHPQESKPTSKAVRDLWRPLSRLPLPRSSKVRQRSQAATPPHAKQYLLMDILTETRSTQMQIPLKIVEAFFRVPRRAPADLKVSIWTDTGLSQPIDRTLVISQGPRHDRLMRRLEMPQIWGLARPLAVLFTRLPGKRRFAFRLISRNSKDYTKANRLLTQHGQQGRAERRFIIGTTTDALWRRAKRFLPH